MKKRISSKIILILVMAVCLLVVSGCTKENTEKEVVKSVIPDGTYVCDSDSSYTIDVSNDSVTMTNADYSNTLKLFLVNKYLDEVQRLEDEGIAVTSEKSEELKQEITDSFDSSLYVGKTYGMTFENFEMDDQEILSITVIDSDKTEVAGLSGSYFPEDGKLCIAGASYHKK